MKSSSEPFFTATPAQERFFEAVFSGKYRFLAYGGGIRSGKSYAAYMLAQTLARIFPGSRWAIVRKDLPTIRRNVLPAFEKVRVPSFTGELNQQAWTYPCANGSAILLFTESYSEDRELNRWRGLEVNGFILEEANELQEVSFRKAIERAGSWVVPGLNHQPPPLVIATFNPSGGWVKRVFYDPHRAGTLNQPYYYQPATILDNPHIPAEYKESLKSLPERDYKRFVEGDWSFVAGAFFDELSADSHLVDPPKLQPYWTYWSAYDWGFRHPAVAMAFAQDTDGNKYLLDTIRMHRLSDEAQAQKLAESLPDGCKRLMFAGHDAFAKRQAHVAALESPSDVFARYGLFCVKANIQRVQGWAAVRRVLTPKQSDGTLGLPQLRICRTAGNAWAIERLLEMIPDPTDPDDLLKVDANEDGEGGDDVADCLRYGMASVAKPASPKGLQDKPDHRAAVFDYAKGAFPTNDDDGFVQGLLNPRPSVVTAVPRMPPLPRNPR